MTANKDRFDALANEIDQLLTQAEAAETAEDTQAATDKAALQEQIRVLEEQIAAGGMTGTEESDALARLEAFKARLAGGPSPGVPPVVPDAPAPGTETPDAPGEPPATPNPVGPQG